MGLFWTMWRVRVGSPQMMLGLKPNLVQIIIGKKSFINKNIFKQFYKILTSNIFVNKN